MARLKLVGTPTSEGYRWIDRDPVLETMLALARKDGRSLTAIAVDAYLSPSTPLNWNKGRVRRPQHISTQFFLRAMGYEMKIVKAENLPVFRWRSQKS